MNRRTGEEERKQDFINLDESECFDVALNDTTYKFVNLMFLFLGPMSMAGAGGRAGFGVLLEVRQAAKIIMLCFLYPILSNFSPLGVTKVQF